MEVRGWGGKKAAVVIIEMMESSFLTTGHNMEGEEEVIGEDNVEVREGTQMCAREEEEEEEGGRDGWKRREEREERTDNFLSLSIEFPFLWSSGG